jgi:hypothetical protein
MIDGKPPQAKLLRQAAQGHMGIIRHTLKYPSLVLPAETIRPVPAHFARCDASGAPLPLRPFDNTRYAHLKNRGYRPGAFASRHTRHPPLTQIHRIRPCHPCQPPRPANSFNLICAALGIPIQLKCDPL